MKNYKTTLASFLTAVALPLLEVYQSGTVDKKTLLTSLGILFIGWYAKDAGVSGTAK